MRHPRRSASAEKHAVKRIRRPSGAALFLLELRVPPEAAEAAGAFLVEAGMGAAVLDEQPRWAKVTCYGEDQTALGRVAESAKRWLADASVSARVRVARAPRALDGWRTGWMRDLTAVRVSPTLWLVPTTAEEPQEPGLKVRLEPSMSFGFGEHPTTRMAAFEVERRCPGGRVLDFGTGSGVLAIVAALTGAVQATGLDIHPAAVDAARANAERNGVDEKCRFAAGTLARLRTPFDLVVANVDLATLMRLAEPLGRRVVPGGLLLLTGFLVEDARDLSRRYRELGFRACDRREDAGWVLLAMRKKSRNAGR